MTIRIASIFSGIGGFEKGIHQADPTTEIVFTSEIDKYARQIYKKNFGVEPHGDITQIDAASIPNHDILCGGFPCQSFSIAGKRRGFEDVRGTLFFEIMRIAESKRPKLLFLENVRGLLSHDEGRTFHTILRSMDDLGYDAEWQVFNSKNHGVPQNRERVFIIGHLRGLGTRQIFPITKIKEAVPETRDGESICAGTLSTRNQSGQTQWDGSTTLIRVNNPTHSNDRIYDPSAVSPSLNANGGGNRQPFIICDSGEGRTDQLRHDVIPPLRANTGAGHNNLVVGVNNPSRGTESRKDGLSCAIKAGECGTKNMICIPILTPDRENKRQAGRRFKDDGDPSFTVTAQDRHGIMTSDSVRRLTPIECERLQGFPDGWTAKGIDEDGDEVVISDTQRYKCLGNAVTVNVIEFIYRHISRSMEEE